MIGELLDRSSWGVMLAGSHWLLMLLACLALAAVFVPDRASWGRSLREERGLTLLETLVVGMLVGVVVLAVIVLA
jgi:cytochrome b561